MTEQGYLKDSIFRIGEIYAVNGREITIKVDKNKNLSHILYQGQLVKNVSVGSYLKIQKGFDRLVAKVEGELLKENHKGTLKNASTKQWTVSVPANGKTTLSFTVQIPQDTRICD